MYSIIKHVNIAGIAAAVPKQIESIMDVDYGTAEERAKFIQMTGISQRRVASENQCASDLCYEAANKLLNDLDWKRAEIEVLIFVTQSPDYFMPSTAIVLQDRLGLPTSCVAFDINLGCSGYIVGLQVAGSLLSSLAGKKALLLMGDTFARKKTIPTREVLPPLFGDCGTATALNWSADAPNIYTESFSDGAGFKHIICETGMYRNPYTMKTISLNEEGQLVYEAGCILDGHAIFNFSTQVVPVSIKSLLEKSNVSFDNVNYFVFHQANKLLNECIRKSLKIDLEKHPYSIEKYANTSSATVPLTMVAGLRDKLKPDTPYTVLASGFGIGLSWGSALLTLKNVYMPEVIEA